ncbi:MAG: Ig-like domain-containing protein [Gammaproteobacteria bacterium]|nr:Ig-like domain-containing protein [Gammaproteobacteria bacterium]
MVPAPGVLANDSDVPADTISAVLVSAPAQGSLSLLADGSFTYTPNADFNGDDSFVYLAEDDDGGQSEEITVDITVLPVNDAPTFTLAAANVPVEEDDGPQSIAGFASDISAGPADEAGQALAFALSVDDPSLFAAGPTLGLDGTLEFTPADNAFGIATVTVTLMDDGGTERGGVDVSAPQVFTITIAPLNDVPVVFPFDLEMDEDGLLTGMLQGVDVDGDPLVFSRAAGPFRGTLVVEPGGGFTYTPNADFFGMDGFLYTAFDGTSFATPATVTIQVRPINDAPVAMDDDYQLNEDEQLNIFLPFIGVLANDDDVDSASLSASLESGPANGNLIFNADGTFLYTPDPDFFGTDTFTYRVSDGELDSNVATVTLTVSPVNDLPVALDQGFSLDEDTVLEDMLSAVDVDGDVLTFTLTTGPANGELVLLEDGSFTYAPDENFFGADSFRFFASDAAGDSGIGTVSLTINPVNDPPVAVDDGYVTNEEMALQVFAPGVLGNDFDVEGTPLLALLVEGPENGTLALSPVGVFTYTPADDFFGTDSFTYRAVEATDVTSQSDVATVTIEVLPINDAPVFTDAVTFRFKGQELTPFIVDFLDPDFPLVEDADGDPLTFTLAGEPDGAAIDADGVLSWTPSEAQGPGSYMFSVIADDGIESVPQELVVGIAEVAAPPVLATIGDRLVLEDELVVIELMATDPDIPASILTFDMQGLPPGAGFDPDTATFTWTPDETQGGMDFELTATVTDDDGLADSETFTIGVAERDTPPVIDTIPDATVTEGETLEFNATATDADLPAGTLTFSLDPGAPDGAVIDPVSGAFSWTPSEAQGPATHEVSVRVTDDTGLSDAVAFTVTVREDENLDAGPAAGDGEPDVWRVALEEGSIVVFLNDVDVYSTPFDGAPAITITGSGDDDELIVDLGSGNPIPAGGIFYAGGGPGDFDSLSLLGEANEVTTSFTGPGAGSIDIDGATITFTGLEPVNDLLRATNRTFDFAEHAGPITLGDDATPGNGVSRIDSPTTELTNFATPSGTLTLRVGAVDVDILVGALDAAGLADVPGLVVDAGEGDNFIDLSASNAPATLVGVGNDTVIAGAPELVVQVGGTDGADVMTLAGDRSSLDVDVNGDARTGSYSRIDELRVLARGGDDTVDASGLADDAVIRGGAGNDLLLGGAGDDTLLGEDGDDVLFGGPGDDAVDGGAGEDVIPATPQPMPIAYWTLDEVSGSVAADVAGSAQNGIYFGNIDKNDSGPPASLAPFGAGTAAEIHNTTSERIVVAHDPVFQVDDGTVMLWFNTDRSSGRQTLFSKDHSGFLEGGHLNIALVNSTIEVRLQSDDASFFVNGKAGAFRTNTWHHLAFSFGAGGMKLYLDGNLLDADPYTGGISDNEEAIVIGGSNRGNSNDSGIPAQVQISEPFDGHIDEVSFFGEALDIDQIRQSMRESALGVDATPGGAGISGDLADYRFGFDAGMLVMEDLRPADSDVIAYWSLNETGGNVAADGAGVPQDGRYIGSIDKDDAGPPAALAPFGAGTAAEFTNDDDDYIAVADHPQFQLAAGTISLWYNTDTTSGERTLISKDHSGFVTGGHLNINTDGSRMEVRMQSTDASFNLRTATGVVKTHTWQHLVLTFGAGGMKLYIDGVLVDEDPYTGGLVGNHEPLVIGGSLRSNTNDSGDPHDLGISQPFDGHIDEVTVLSRELSPAEIARLRSEGAQSFIDEAAAGPGIEGTDRINGIELIELADGGVAEVRGAGSERSDPIGTADVLALTGGPALAVLGDVGEPITLTGDWTDLGTESIGPNAFHRYMLDDATVLVLEGMDVTTGAVLGIASAGLDEDADEGAPLASWSVGSAGDSGIVYGRGVDIDDAGDDGIDLAAEFHGTSRDYIAISHDERLALDRGSVELWFNPDRLRGKQTLLSKEQRGSGDGHLNIGLKRDRLEVRLDDGERSHRIRTSGLVQTDNWYHLLFSFGESGMRLYLDGELVGSNDYAGGIQGNREPLVLGGSLRKLRDGAGDLARVRVSDPLDGRIEHMAIYGETLTPDTLALRAGGDRGEPLLERGFLAGLGLGKSKSYAADASGYRAGAETRDGRDRHHDWLELDELAERPGKLEAASLVEKFAGKVAKRAEAVKSDWLIDVAAEREHGAKSRIDWTGLLRRR